ncbi:Fcf1-domain-containing protein, partial [Rozella allomycis CSF55]
MKSKRTKRTKKQMSVYIHTFGFYQPFQVIGNNYTLLYPVDGNLIHHAVQNKIILREALPKLLQEECKLIVTDCIITELKALGEGFGASAAAARRFEIRKCQHEGVLSACECIKHLIGERNENRYTVATQDRALRRVLRELPAVPLVYYNKAAFILEPVSETTMRRIDQVREKTGLTEHDRMQIRRLEKELNVKKKVEKVGVKRKVPGNPNPLSCKKKK